VLLVFNPLLNEEYQISKNKYVLKENIYFGCFFQILLLEKRNNKNEKKDLNDF